MSTSSRFTRSHVIFGPDDMEDLLVAKKEPKSTPIKKLDSPLMVSSLVKKRKNNAEIIEVNAFDGLNPTEDKKRVDSMMQMATTYFVGLMEDSQKASDQRLKKAGSMDEKGQIGSNLRMLGCADSLLIRRPSLMKIQELSPCRLGYRLQRLSYKQRLKWHKKQK